MAVGNKMQVCLTAVKLQADGFDKGHLGKGGPYFLLPQASAILRR